MDIEADCLIKIFQFINFCIMDIYIGSEQHYDTNNFYQKLEYEVWAEDNYFNRHLKPVEKKRLKGFLSKEWINIDTLEYIPHLLANIYIHNCRN